jgi:hypothetical protein
VGARERGGYGSEREGGRREKRGPRAAVPVHCRCHRPAPALIIDGGAGHARVERASGAGAEWGGGGGMHADLALGWRREEVGAHWVSGAGAEWGGSGGWWGGGARVDLVLGRRREEAGARSVFFSMMGCAVEDREACGFGLFCLWFFVAD